MIWMGVGELKTLDLLLGQDLKILSLNILEKNSKASSYKSKLNKKSKGNPIWGKQKNKKNNENKATGKKKKIETRIEQIWYRVEDSLGQKLLSS